MKYQTEINWNGTHYGAPKGYYFLNVGDTIIKGDGFFTGTHINNYYLEANNKIILKNWSFPSVRPIPVAPAPAKLQYKEITDIAPGDLFIDGQYGNGVVVIQCRWETDKYSLSGRDGLHNWSNSQEITKQQMIDYLNQHKKIFICNINDKIKKTIEAARKLV